MKSIVIVLASVIGGFIAFILLASVVFGYIAKKGGQYESRKKGGEK